LSSLSTKIRWSFATVLVIGVMTLLWIKTRSVDADRHARIIVTMRGMREADEILSQQALKVRFGTVTNYDSLASGSDGMGDLSAQLQADVFPVSDEDALRIRGLLDAYAESHAEKHRLLGEFTSANALLSNSLRFFPVAIERARAAAASEDERHGIDLLLRDTLLFGLRGDSRLKPSVQTRLDALARGWSDQPASAPDPLAVACLDADGILRHKSSADDLLSSVLALPTRERATELYLFYHGLHSAAVRTADGYRAGLYVVCVGLAMYCGWSVLRLGRSAAALARSNETLEQRVVERTAQFESARREAEESTRCKSEFLANMSHEIRTPMTAILGYADLMVDRSQSAADRNDSVQTIRRNASHLLSIINDILDISKIEAGKLHVEHVQASPAEIMADVEKLLRPRALEQGLAFDVDIPGAVPSRIHTDPTRLRQIIMNLTSNAVKFTVKGGICISCRMATSPDAERPVIRFDVSDTGIGIAPSEMESLFGAFMQADTSTTRKFGGTGLGLMISKRLARMLGGDITVVSEPGKGSTFSLEVQTGSLHGVAMIHGPMPSQVPADSTAGSAVPSDALRGVRILFAEDGPDNQRLISFVLKKAGAGVEIAENGRIAVDKVLTPGAVAFDVILMDMQMPELDGYGATAELRTRGYRGPIIALTAHAMEGNRERCVEAGCDEYATKPIDRNALVALIRAFVSVTPRGFVPA